MRSTVLVLLDPFRGVQLFFVLVAIGWLAVMATPECTMCQEQFEGFLPRTDEGWEGISAALAAVGLIGICTNRIGWRVLAMAVTSAVWGVVSVMFFRGPHWVTGDAVYPPMVVLSWTALAWAAWRARP